MAKLYKGSTKSDANNAKTTRKRSSEITIPYQPVRGGAKVLKANKARSTPKSGTLKLKLRKTR